MIDLHMHTTHSDGDKSVREILEMAEAAKLKVISITDHDNVEAYKEIQSKNLRGIFSGKIVNGVEITTEHNGVAVEILGYGIDLAAMESNMIVRALMETKPHRYQEFFKILKRHGITLPVPIDENINSRIVFGALKQNHPEFCAAHAEFSKDNSWFYRTGIVNPKSEFFVDMGKFLTPSDQVIKNIRKSGGVAILAHPYEYGDARTEILEFFKSRVDGIECFHPSATPAQSAELVEFCRANNLLVSGGSDFHGGHKPHIKLGYIHGAQIPAESVTVLASLAQAKM
jgi:predicted metal-dependent phosphoesterase TrpH